MRPSSLVRYLPLFAFGLAIAASASADKTNILGTRTKVTNGMVHFGDILRKIIPLKSVSLPAPLRYASGNNCTFDMFWKRPGAAELNGEMKINTAPVRDRIAISITGFETQSSLLISPTGTITNFNTMDPFSRQRVTAKSLPAFAEKTKALMRKLYPDATNEDMLLGYPMLPRLVDNDGSVGAKVAVLDSLNGEWAAYYYQGMTTYEGYSGALLDLVRVMNINGKPTNVRVGFLVAETHTMMPLVFVFENYDQMHGKVTRCDR